MKVSRYPYSLVCWLGVSYVCSVSCSLTSFSLSVSHSIWALCKCIQPRVWPIPSCHNNSDTVCLWLSGVLHKTTMSLRYTALLAHYNWYSYFFWLLLVIGYRSNPNPALYPITTANTKLYPKMFSYQYLFL